ncbi:hypothetical protein BCR36DRAFT_371213 [Piromyces finnis]|uniref:Uncharacterized protein n=1 Tax=Piromyces finnis TaxID=1754191 RepID=A0A1Y1V702_9FUNG|nr:hypothetical protein BCR36DRAFT_371213 [Piromyces finnis]|eukprot:ORX48724.1 hypothetical protein BCR36DRAFT_371213 [Piromyces finnis]
MENKLKIKRSSFKLIEDDEIIITPDLINSPLDYLKSLNKEQQEECLRYLKLSTYKGDPTLEDDLLFLLNTEIKSMKSTLENSNLKYKKFLFDKLSKYETIRERLKLRLEYNKTKFEGKLNNNTPKFLFESILHKNTESHRNYYFYYYSFFDKESNHYFYSKSSSRRSVRRNTYTLRIERIYHELNRSVLYYGACLINIDGF